MQKNWQHFLEQQHAEIKQERVLSFGNLQQELDFAYSENVIADLSHKGLIKVAGAEAQKFLQGQLTCDMQEVNTERSLLGAHCNAKGRILAAFRIFQKQDNYYLFMPKSIIAPTLAQLQKYALFSKVTLTEASNELLSIGIAGKEMPKILQAIFNHIPTSIDTVIQQDVYTIISIHGPMPRFEIFAEAPALIELWQKLAAQLKPINADAWQLLTIMAGVPTVYPATIGHFTPHLINYPALNGVSFRKGCYTGQEVIARMEHLGKLKSHMYRGYLQIPNIPKPGDLVFATSHGDKNDVGSVVLAKRDRTGGFQLLLVLQDTCAKDDLVYVKDYPDAKVKLLDLPYTVKM